MTELLTDLPYRAIPSAAIMGLAVVGLGAAWLTQQLWVLLIALAIGGEELLETSVLLYAMRRGRRIERAAAPAE